ncbi:MAG TPA: hypothetical protein VLA75_07120, partial [Thermoanaerobaculia bacterium]|nr:hypothetical protein [Thermoanaerobaculia bacterium]
MLARVPDVPSLPAAGPRRPGARQPHPAPRAGGGEPRTALPPSPRGSARMTLPSRLLDAVRYTGGLALFAARSLKV